MKQTLIEKIVERYAVDLKPEQHVYAQDFVSVRPKHVMTHDNTGAVIPKFRSIGATKIFDPAQPVFALDHDVQNTSPQNLAKYAEIEEFAKANAIPFFPAGSGIAHQIMIEECFATPGTLIVASDSHSNIYGAVAALGTPVVRTDAAAIWATGETWWQVPPVIKVTLTGELEAGVTGKDVIMALIGTYNHDEVLNSVLEFGGPGVAHLTMAARLTIANMTTEWGALAGVFPYDVVLRDFLLERAAYFQARGDAQPRMTSQIVAALDKADLQPDPDGYYAKEIVYNLADVMASVAGPNEVNIVSPLQQVEQAQIKIDKAYLVSCVNSRLEDIKAAAQVLENKKVAPGVKFYLAAASAAVEREARRLGYWHTLTEAGAITLPAGCGPCIGLGQGVLEAGEVAISATNRNFKGRMGSGEATVYLASPATVAASAAAGFITGAKTSQAQVSRAVLNQIKTNTNAAVIERGAVKILTGFPRVLEGELLFAPKDNMNTDAIYGKEFTYQDKLTPEEMAKVAMLNYDPKFQEIAQHGDILVGGWNFGTGSSREQAATCLKYRGIQLVVAGSYSQTYKRNAFNNGYIVLECPTLVELLKNHHPPTTDHTIRTGERATFDFEHSQITAFGQSFAFSPLGEVAQALVIAGGFEQLLQKRIQVGS